MSIDSNNTWELWNSEKPIIPPRSSLHHLEAVGIGTPYVESLTSYIARLAESHSVLPGILMSRELVSPVQKLYVKSSASMGLHALFNRAHAFNGTGDMARDWVEALEKLTLRNDLRLLTLLSCAEIFPSHGLLRNRKAWCPTCYQDWLMSEQIVYDPLVWTIEVVKVCSHHYRPLRFHCPHCQQQLLLLDWRSRPGYCSHCDGWLGTDPKAVPWDDESLLKEELKWQSWTADNICGLIAAAPHFSSPLSKQNVAKAIRTATDIVTEGNIAAFAGLLGIPKNTLWMWHTGKALPQLNVLLKICYRLEISLLDFLTPEKVVAKSLKLSLQKSPERSRNKRVSPKPFDSGKVEEALQASIASDEKPPRTLQQIAKQLGYDRRTIFRHFPELCHAISTKSQSYKKASRLRKIEQSCEQVQQIALELRNKGAYPSEARVSELMSKPGDFRYKSIRAALQKAQRETGA